MDLMRLKLLAPTLVDHIVLRSLDFENSPMKQPESDAKGGALPI